VGDGSAGGFQFWGTDVANGQNKPLVVGVGGLGGSCIIAAVGQEGRPNNPTVNPQTGGPSPGNLATNQAYVVANGTTTLTGTSGQIAFNSRVSPVDSQYVTGSGAAMQTNGIPAIPASGGSGPPSFQSSFMDGRYANCGFVIPPSAQFQAEMTISFLLSSTSIKCGNMLLLAFDEQNVQDLMPVKGTGDDAYAVTSGYLSESTRISDTFIVETSVPNYADQNQVPLPAGHACWCYWTVWPNGQDDSTYGDHVTWDINDVPFSMTLTALPLGGNVNGIVGQNYG
jgi:hypothetical protein